MDQAFLFECIYHLCQVPTLQTPGTTERYSRKMRHYFTFVKGIVFAMVDQKVKEIIAQEFKKSMFFFGLDRSVEIVMFLWKS